MLQKLKALLGIAPPINYKQLLEQGAVIIDVRTKAEFQSGHLKNSKNIPLSDLGKQAKSVPKEKTIILCCASGMRSGAAKRLLKSKGFAAVYNAGSWRSLKGKLETEFSKHP